MNSDRFRQVARHCVLLVHQFCLPPHGGYAGEPLDLAGRWSDLAGSVVTVLARFVGSRSIAESRSKQECPRGLRGVGARRQPQLGGERRHGARGRLVVSTRARRGRMPSSPSLSRSPEGVTAAAVCALRSPGSTPVHAATMPPRWPPVRLLMSSPQKCLAGMPLPSGIPGPGAARTAVVGMREQSSDGRRAHCWLRKHESRFRLSQTHLLASWKTSLAPP